jgi:hypothetical protein
MKGMRPGARLGGTGARVGNVCSAIALLSGATIGSDVIGCRPRKRWGKKQIETKKYRGESSHNILPVVLAVYPVGAVRQFVN